jgi:hypothetical protein
MAKISTGGGPGGISLKPFPGVHLPIPGRPRMAPGHTVKAPRIKPTSTRQYGKGGPLQTDPTQFGGGIGFGDTGMSGES